MALVLSCTSLNEGFACNFCQHNYFYAPPASSSRKIAVSMSCPWGIVNQRYRLLTLSRKAKRFSIDQPTSSNNHASCIRSFRLHIVKKRRLWRISSSELHRADMNNEEAGFTDISPISEPAPTHLDLLERITVGTSKGGVEKDSTKLQSTIAEQLAKRCDPEEAVEVTVPLGTSNAAPLRTLTLSQKRNIRRQQYLDEVAKRDDAPFFATVAAFIFVPPAVILGVAIASGYVDILP